jgi:hypothetical protein
MAIAPEPMASAVDALAGRSRLLSRPSQSGIERPLGMSAFSEPEPRAGARDAEAGESWVLELRSGEVATLMEGLTARRSLYDHHGIRWGDNVYVEKAQLPEVVQAFIDAPEGEVGVALAGIAPERLVALGRRLDLSQLDQLLAEWLARVPPAPDPEARPSTGTGTPATLMQREKQRGKVREVAVVIHDQRGGVR